MVNLFIKNTLFLTLFLIISCVNGNVCDNAFAKSSERDSRPTEERSGKADSTKNPVTDAKPAANTEDIIVGANQTEKYIPLLKGKRVAIITNPSALLFKSFPHTKKESTHIVDSLISSGVNVVKVFSPEHGFRGDADAGEKVKDGQDPKTGLPIISLHGKNKKPTQEQLDGLDVLVFDIQDVGVRFYTYISTLTYVMEAAAEKGIPVIVLDRPNPNAHYIDGPTLEPENSSFLGMHPVPLVYGMTIGEYAQMVIGEQWIDDADKALLTVIPLGNWTREMKYSLPVRPSPNLPNDTSINLYPSLGFFEGTHINAGRGTEMQFQILGSSQLPAEFFPFTYTPQPNFGSKNPKEKGKLCQGLDLRTTDYMERVNLEWLIEAYTGYADKANFFKTRSFTLHAGNTQLQKQIEQGYTFKKIKSTWIKDIENFKKIRTPYLLYQ